jgi:steroid 5-alpha reductase family enzyme
MLVLWAVQRRGGDAAVADLGWTLGVGGLALVHAVGEAGYAPRRWLVGAMGGLWALRLALHLLRDRLRRPGEDGRYRALRQRWGNRAQGYFLLLFLAQVPLALFFSLPFLVLTRNPATGFAPAEWAGLALWLLALAGETLADRQLALFRADPARRVQVCEVGLWRYSRHPNYFCEWLLWCAYALMATAAPQGAVALTAPLAMLFLLYRGTGIPHAEAQALRRRGEAYVRYQRRTNTFFPWFPKKDLP